MTLVNFAVHPEVLGNDVGILSPDLVGPFAERVESQGGGMALFMNGAQGGMVTADNRLLDQPSDPVRGYWQRQSHVGRVSADRAADGRRGAADRARRAAPAGTRRSTAHRPT